MLCRRLICILSIHLALAGPSQMVLNHDDVVLMGSGRMTVLNGEEFRNLRKGGLLMPAYNHDILGLHPPPARQKLQPRRVVQAVHKKLENALHDMMHTCKDDGQIEITEDKVFLSFDIPLSPIVSASGGPATVSISRAASIANTIDLTEGMEAQAGILKEALTLALYTSYQETWTTTDTTALVFTVPPGKNGVIVSEPYTRRTTGNFIDGCNHTKIQPAFVTNTYATQYFGSMRWVNGIIRLCSSDQYPIPYCNGNSTHI